MLAVITTLVLAANPAQPKEPPKSTLPPAEEIHFEVNRRIDPVLAGCRDLIQVAGVQDQSAQLEFHVLPTGKVNVGGKTPSEPLAALVFRCGLFSIGPVLNVKVKNVSTVDTHEWSYATDTGGTGLAWVADDPKSLDREVMIASENWTWLRCEHKDAALTFHGSTRDISKLMAAPDFKAAVADSDSDTATFWKVVRTKDGKHELSAHRGALPAFAKTIEQSSGLTRICEPVRVLGEKAGDLLTAKSKALAGCLKHRHNDLWLTLTLNGGGAVTKADARATSGLDDKQLDCLERVAAKWSFPYKGEGGATLSAHLQAAPPGE